MKHLVLAGIVLGGALCSLFSQIGININFSERGGTFTDLAKENYRWNVRGAAITSSDADSLGWPSADADFIYDARPVAEWNGEIDDPEEYRIDMSGTYLCSFRGQAALSATGGAIQNVNYDESTNTTTFEFILSGPPAPGHGFFILTFSETKRLPASAAGTGFTDFKMMRPGFPLDHPDKFIPPFIQALQGIAFECIRFMPFTGANDVEPAFPEVLTWEQRKLLTDASYGAIPSLGKMDGAPWELVVEVGNRLAKDIWINVPVSANPEYIRNLAAMIQDNLSSDLNVYVESSNEVWNSIFPQQPYNVAQAEALGLEEHQNHARRTLELAEIFEEVFGSGALNSRVRVILPSHAPMLKWWVVPMLEYIESNYGPPANYLYGISSQGYFSIPSVAGQTLDEILDVAESNIQGQIDETGGVNEAGRLQWVETARDWSLPGGYLIYEGGAHPPLGNLDNIDNVIGVERSVRMGELLKLNYQEGFLDVGGTLAMHFILSSAYTRYGSFGLTDDINYPERNFKYAALRDLAGPGAGIRKTFQQVENFKQIFLPSHHRQVILPGEAAPGSLSVLDVRGSKVDFFHKWPLGANAKWTLEFSHPLKPGMYWILTSQTGNYRLLVY